MRPLHAHEPRPASPSPSASACRESAVPGETLGRFNVCPTEPVLAVCDGEARALRWGLIPPWARKLRAGPEPINARAESLLDKRLFAPLIGDAAHRCLVPADGWYEWLRPEHPKGARTPFRYTVDDGALFAFAGLWREGRVGDERIGSMTILTTTANAVCAPVHDRMPVVLPRRRPRPRGSRPTSTPPPRSSSSRRSRRRAPRPRPRTPP